MKIKNIRYGLLLISMLVGGSESASAFSATNANTIVDAWNTAFYSTSGGAHYKDRKSGGDTGWWQQAECIEALIDAAVRRSFYSTRVSEVVNGFSSIRGTSWSYNTFNDDIAWGCLMYLRASQITGNTTFRNIAKANFDMMYARAWDTSAGGLWWTTGKTSKTSAVMGPAAIVAYKLYQQLGTTSYRDKAIAINNWQRNNCYNASNGQVYDSPSNQVPTTYNQGTFIQASYLRGNTGTANLACKYLQGMGGQIVNGHRILPQYGFNNNNSGFNGIAVRWANAYMKASGTQSTFLGWLQTNAQQAWITRRTSDNLSGCNWGSATPSTDIGAWTCSSSVAAINSVQPTE
jgi:predicted alpha-1,6-mannanase (GH76 family)